jgi:hypothetical protein
LRHVIAPAYVIFNYRVKYRKSLSVVKRACGTWRV